MIAMVRALALGASVAIALPIVACGPTGPVYIDPTVCPQTREFGNFGCARFAAILTTASQVPVPGIALHATLLDSANGVWPNGLSSEQSDEAGRVGLQFTWYEGRPKSDTIRVRVVALRPGAPGKLPEPIDSLDVNVYFARVGQRARLDTLRWQLRQ
jgi:hypothetical protein